MDTAVIADIHGNAFALQAVFDDIESRGITNIVNLGDSLDTWMDPSSTADLLMAKDVPSLLGNDETATDEQLSAAQRAWRDSLPKTLVLDEVSCCHGTPQKDTQALLEEINERGVRLASDKIIRERLGNVTQEIILCAHTHTPHTVRLSSGHIVVNPGSVGLPAYQHDQPVEHIMQTGSPHARYAIISKNKASQDKNWSIQHISLTYDWHAAAALARASGRSDRAEWLLTGRAEPTVS